MRALLGEHSFHDRVSKFFRTKATLALSKKLQRVARGKTVEKVRFGGKIFYWDGSRKQLGYQAKPVCTQVH